MSAAHISPVTPQSQQRGVVLVVSLMILLVLTLVGISSLDGSIMEEKMAANTQTANVAFQATESAIRQTFLVESQDLAGAWKNAGIGATTNYNDASLRLTASTVMSVPATAITGHCGGTSDGSSELRTIEITGNASIGGGINSRITQGYSACMMATNPDS